ncbi:(5-formylfuran-3-yl)methyl phosphate synthase [Blastopirellula marina]|uniref:(5-formylfuran-3-yl)methyl phosphate synthase n=1 Tax=Blastopirellula marina DSM 3645 TaxID=314230 RepID=A3ZQH6_9BACT|nr:(5-formylfuran-3-yl)methyl phosphate synthase [Blastopirellula marina]EAQ81452.1 hypothetical protein DSM3645_23711 [Blastopirellula marina DSM 3645]
MTQLLVSVRSAIEAEAALSGGADWIDIKEPTRGSLGAAEPHVWREIVQTVEQRAPVSIALGEISDGAGAWGPDTFRGASMVKYGLAKLSDCTDWMSIASTAYDRVPDSCSRVAVYYADEERARCPPLADVVQWSKRISASAILIDTFVKDGRTLFDFLSIDQLAAATQQIRAIGAIAACGGSLTKLHFAAAIVAGADVLAVRGAVCNGRRTSAIDQQLVRQLKATMNSFDGESNVSQACAT